jgi:protein-S-isoprenylcysteine O-methyltransferase Ste14
MTTIIWFIRLIFAQWIVIFYPGVFVFWFIIHTNIERWRAIGTRSYWVAAFAWMITAGPLLFFRRDLFGVRWEFAQYLEVALGIGGIFAFCLAIALLRRAGKKISIRTLVGFPELKLKQNPQPILNSGIYSQTRNPVYLAHWLLVLSAAAVTNFAANWVLFALDCLVLPVLIRTEERELLTRYGSDYAGYMQCVPRFFPRLR